MKKIVQINPVLRINTSTGRIMQEVGELAMANGWENYIAYSRGRDGILPCKSKLIPIGSKWSVALHGLETRLLDRHGLASKCATKAFIQKLKNINPDIIHIHNIHGYFLNYPLLFKYLAQSGIPVVWTIHDCWLYTGHCYHYAYKGCYKWREECSHCPQQKEFPASWLVDRSHQNFLDKKKAFTSLRPGQLTIVPVSDWICGEMKHSFLKEARFRVIHNGINTEVFHPSNSIHVKKKYGLEDKHILLGIASIWSEEKGLKDFIKLSELISEEERIVLVGIKPKQQKLLPVNIIPIRRTENIQQLAELYSAADVFINPTWQDNYPTVNLEAISCGTPVVTYRTGGSIEAVTEKTGFVVEQGDVEGLLRAARTIECEGKSLYRDSCREYALANFRKEDRYADYLQLYDELIAKQ